MSRGYLALVLHAHLPFVKHQKEGELAEEWLYEAITESYIPLLIVLNRLIQKGVDYQLTISISPTLITMLADPLLQLRYKKHLEKLIELSEKEIDRTKNEPQFHHLAKMYNDLFNKTYDYYHIKYKNNLLKAFKELEETGKIELITTCATHGYLPLMLTGEAINAQIKMGIDTYRRVFNKRPKGLWLPECAFKPAVEPYLAQNNIRYFICSSHGLLFAKPRPRYGLYAPIFTPSGIAAFGRDTESSRQVWSAAEGYPGDYDYREYYRDIGWDLDYEYIKDYLPSGVRKNTGLKYYRITGKGNWKEPYNPEAARRKAAEHAGNFMFNRQQQVKYLSQVMDRKPIVVSPYDAELFGHWWFEGPMWLEFLLEKIHFDQEDIETITLSGYLKREKKKQYAMPSEASWGHRGYHEVWLNGSNDWIYRQLHEAEERLIKLASKYKHLANKNSLIYRALNQMCRELLLAQSSDWAFIINARTMVDYAVFRTKKHLDNFSLLAEGIMKNQLEERKIAELEKINDIFPDLDFKIYQRNTGVKLGKEIESGNAL